MRLLRPFGWNGAGLLGEGEVRVAARVRLHHALVAGQLRRDGEFLLPVIDVRDRPPRPRLDQRPDPHARAEDEAGIAWLVSSGACAECGQNDAVAAVVPDLEIVEPQICEGAAELAQWRHGWVATRHLPEGVIAHVELPTIEPRPWDTGPHKPRLESVALEGAALVDAIVGVHARDELVLDRRPVLAQLAERLHVNRHAREFHPGGGGHVAATQQCPGEIN